MAPTPAVTEEQPTMLPQVQGHKTYAHERAIRRVVADAPKFAPKYRQRLVDALRAALDEVSA